MEQTNNTNIKLNFLKGVACMGVVFMHITFPGMFGQIVLYASAYAVPVFFMIAGYYAWGKGPEVVKRRLFKIIRIFIYAYALFFAYQMAYAVRNHETALWFATHFNWKTPIKYICFCTIDFAIPLWYLIAMIETYVTWLLIVKHEKEKLALKTLPVLFILQILLTSYCDTMQLAWFWKTNFVTRALPWFLLGYYMRTDGAEKLRDAAHYKLIIMAAIGCAIAVAPAAFSLSFKFNVVGYIPYAFGLFALALKNPGSSVCKTVEFIGEKLSLNIYILHVPVSGVLSTIFNHLLKVDRDIYIYIYIPGAGR